jgi:ammonium transporter, Amt family
MKRLAAILLMLLVGCTIAFSQERANDPSGANTGGAADVTAAKAGEPTVAELAAFVGHNRVAINMMWTLITGFIVMFMQTGFAMVETD